MATSAVFGNLLALANDPHLLQQGPVEGVTHGGQGQQQAGAAGQAGQSSAAAPDGIRRVCNMEGKELWVHKRCLFWLVVDVRCLLRGV